MFYIWYLIVCGWKKRGRELPIPNEIHEIKNYPQFFDNFLVIFVEEKQFLQNVKESMNDNPLMDLSFGYSCSISSVKREYDIQYI